MKALPEGLRYMAASALCFSVMGALVKYAGGRLPTMEIVLARSLVVLALSAWGLRGVAEPWGRERGLLLVRGLFGFIALSCSYYAVIHLPLAAATVIQYTHPVLTALIALPVLGEAIRAAELALAALSLVGVLLVARPPFLSEGGAPPHDPAAVLVALGAAIFSAAAYVMVRRLRHETPLVIVFYFALVSALGSLPAVAFHWVPPEGVEWAVLLGVGLSTHAGQVLLTHGLRREPAGRATAVGYLQIVFATLWGVLFFSEVPDRWTVAGAGVIVASVLLLARTRRAARPGSPAAV